MSSRDAVGTRIGFNLPDITEAEEKAVVEVLRSGWLTTGDECASLEAELAEYLGVDHVVAVSSCTAAIEIAYAALGLPPGARVGVPAWTFVSSALAPAHHGAHIVLLDVEPDTLNLSLESLDAALSPADGTAGLDAVVGVHFAGTPLSAAVRDRCAVAGVPLIEDGAHALGARDDRGMVAGQGTAGACFSFYATKNLVSGEGGALATDDPALAGFARSFRLHGLDADAWARYRPGARGGYDVVHEGIKANLPDLLATVARVQLERFPAMQAWRRALVERYRQQLAALPVTVVPGELPDGAADHLLVVLLPEGVDRDEVRGHMDRAGVGTSVHFTPIHRFSWFASSGSEVGPAGLGTTEALEPRALSLPLYTLLGLDDVDRVCAALGDAIGSPARR